MIIIGEKINGSIPSVAEAIANRDAEFIKQRALAQANSGASYIDCCASVPEAEEVETLKWMIDCIQEVTDLPISVDSPSADVLTEAYKFCRKPGIFNSVSGEGDKIDKRPGGLLHRRFTLTRRGRAVCSLLRYLSGHPGRTLSAIVLYGARKFLSRSQ